MVSIIISDIGALYKASEAIALLDMLWAYAHSTICNVSMVHYQSPTLTRSSTQLRCALLTLVKKWLTLLPVRPEFTGTLAVKGGRHPILECITAAGIIVPNDVYCSDAASFQIIQGPKCALQ
jgi:DNA mismatch repair protein MSH4